MIEKALVGGRRYWALIILLLTIIGVGFVSYLYQWSYGLGVTGLSRPVSWGLYIANFTFFVGVAASAVLLVLPAYIYGYKKFEKITALGEFLAVGAVTMCILFILVDLGQPVRAFYMLRYPSPNSVMFWDMVVLGGYLLLNLVIGWYVLDASHKSVPPRAVLKPLILLSIPWAISIHTVTAFLYSGLIARPFWMTALMAPRFLASAFASGPAILIILGLIIRRYTKFDPGKEALQKLGEIAAYAMIITTFFIGVELFTTFYGKIPEHMAHFQYFLFGLEGKTTLVPWTWLSAISAFVAIALLVNPGTRKRDNTLAIASVLVVIAVWIEKGLTLIMTGYIPTPSGVLVEYWPTVPEALITLGIWALGFLIVTILYKVVISVREEMPAESEEAEEKPTPASTGS